MTDVENTNTNGRLRPRRKNTTKTEPTRNLRRSGDNTASIGSTSSSTSISTTLSDATLPIEKGLLAGQFLCLYCERIFPGKKSLSKHVQRIHQRSTRKDTSIKCNFCSHVETDTRHIIAHMLDSHPNQYFTCSGCLHRFASSQELNNHCLYTCNGEQQKELPYRNKLRHKNHVNSPTSNQKADAAKTFEVAGNEPLLAPEPNNVTCEVVKKGDIDFEESISMNFILPPCKSLSPGSLHEKRPVIVLDDIQWKQKSSNINAIQSGDRADQILSRLGVVHRSRGTETSRYWYRHIDESSKFERCFDTNFYLKVANNVQENLLKFLDGTLNVITPKDDEPIKTRKSKNNVLINTIEGFPTLLATGQYSRNTIDDLPRAIAPKQKWKWDNTDNDKQTATHDDLGIIKRDSHTNKCIVGLFSSLDIWTQLRMRHKHEETFKGTVAIEKQSTSSKELKDIIESRELPNTSSQIVKYTSRQSYSTEGLDFPTSLGLVPSAPECEIEPAILSGEWARKRCYVCCACGERSQDPKSLSAHHSIHHPHAQVNNYEIVGEELLNADILKHLYVPPALSVKKRLPLRGSKTCTKCDRHMMAEELHQHMLECAGDTPVPRRKVRQRPFGVRRRRTRLPESAIHKQHHKTIRNRRTRQKKLIRARPIIRTPVGDAETIKKMIADLPAKRRRVTANQACNSSRTINRREKQMQMRMKRHSSENEVSRSNLKQSDSVQSKITRSKLPPKDTKVNDMSNAKSSKKLISKGKVLKIKITRKTVIRKSERKTNDHILKRRNMAVFIETTTTETTSSERAINITSNFLENSPSNQSIVTRSASGGNGASNPRRGGTLNLSNSQSGRNTSQNVNGPKNTVPLKHSIASLTATPHVESYRGYPQVNLPQNVSNDLSNNFVSPFEEQRALIEDEAFAKKLDKPPLSTKTDDLSGSSKSKSSKPRRGLNDCIAMLKGKLGDSGPPRNETSSNLPSSNDSALPTENKLKNNQTHPDNLFSSSIHSVDLCNSMTPLDLSGKTSHSPTEELLPPIPASFAKMTPICLPPVQSEPLPLVTGPSKPLQLVSIAPATTVSNATAPIIITPSLTVFATAPSVGLVPIVPQPKSSVPVTSAVATTASNKRTSDVRRSSEKTSPKGGQIRFTEKLSSQKPVFDPTLKIPQYKVRHNVVQDNDPKELPTDSTVAILPKEIVEILGTMSAQHRNTLLNALPQVFAKTVKDLKLVVDSNVSKESLSSPNRSEIATQTINTSPEQEFPAEFVNIDTDKFLIDPVTGTITERPEKEIMFPPISETNVSIKEAPRLDVIDLTFEEEDHEKNISEKSTDVFLPPPSSKISEEPVLGINISSSALNMQSVDTVPPSPIKSKATNDKTSSLRAVRIKSANEKQKLLSANITLTTNVPQTQNQVSMDKNILDIKDPPPTNILTLETTVCAAEAGSMTSPAIQQAEISSTQQSSINAAKSNQSCLGNNHNIAIVKNNLSGLNDFKGLPLVKPKENIPEPETTPIIDIKFTESSPKIPEVPSEDYVQLHNCDTLIIDSQCTQFQNKGNENHLTPTTVCLSPHTIGQNDSETHPTEKAFIHPEELRESPKPEESQCNHISENGPTAEDKLFKEKTCENIQSIVTKITDTKHDCIITNTVTNEDDDPEDDVSLAVMVKQKKSQIDQPISDKRVKKAIKNIKKPNKENDVSLTSSGQILNKEQLFECKEYVSVNEKPVTPIKCGLDDKDITEGCKGPEITLPIGIGKKRKGITKSQLQDNSTESFEQVESKENKQNFSLSPLPLRRSRRGKSEFVEPVSTIDQFKEAPSPTVNSIESKIPLTKKQLIFSKLLDEKKSQDLKLKDPSNPKSVNVIDSDTFHGELILECESLQKAENIGKLIRDSKNDQSETSYKLSEVEQIKKTYYLTKKKSKSIKRKMPSYKVKIHENRKSNFNIDCPESVPGSIECLTKLNDEELIENLSSIDNLPNTDKINEQIASVQGDLSHSSSSVDIKKRSHNQPNIQCNADKSNMSPEKLQDMENTLQTDDLIQNTNPNSNLDASIKKKAKRTRGKKITKDSQDKTMTESNTIQSESPVTSSTDGNIITNTPLVEYGRTLSVDIVSSKDENNLMQAADYVSVPLNENNGTAVVEDVASKNDDKMKTFPDKKSKKALSSPKRKETAIKSKRQTNKKEDCLTIEVCSEDTKSIESNTLEIIVNEKDNNSNTEDETISNKSKEISISDEKHESIERLDSHLKVGVEEDEKDPNTLFESKKTSITPLKKKVGSRKSKKTYALDDNVMQGIKINETVTETVADNTLCTTTGESVQDKSLLETKTLQISLKRKRYLNQKKSKTKKHKLLREKAAEIENVNSKGRLSDCAHELADINHENIACQHNNKEIGDGMIGSNDSFYKNDLINEMSYATRRTRSKSVLFKTVTATSPQDFDILVCDSEFANNTIPSDDTPKEPVTLASNEENQPVPLAMHETLNKNGCKKKKPNSLNKNKQETNSKSSTVIELHREQEPVKIPNNLPGEKSTQPVSSLNDEFDSDDSSKSDVPLTKYVQEISKKKTEKLNATLPVKSPNSKHGSSARQIKLRRKTVAICGNLTSNKNPESNEEQTRSDQFMESFGFFSERKPRKSNLLAAKKIFETFHLASNDNEELSHRDNERVTRKNPPKESGKNVSTNETNTKLLNQENNLVKSEDTPPNKKRCTLQDVKNKSKISETYCDICKKEFRRQDNLSRHQLTLFHISNVSAIEMNLPPKTLENEPPNCLVVYRRHLENLKRLNELEGGNKLIELPSLSDILKMTNPEKYGPLTGHKVSGRDLSKDEALFYECCELLKESYKNDKSKCEPSTSGQQSRKSYLIMGPKVNEVVERPVDKDEDVDSITAKEILESEEVRNLENDAISGLTRAKTVRTFNDDTVVEQVEPVAGPYDFSSDNESKLPDIKTSRYSDKALTNCIDSEKPKETPNITKKEKIKTLSNQDEFETIAAIPSTSTGIFENMDLFEDKFDKIKRKCRSQAAAAKNANISVESQKRGKQKKTPEKKSGQKKESKHQRAVPTKGALKGFDGIKVSIPTSDIKLPAIVPNVSDHSVKKKRKKVRSKKTSNLDIDSEKSALSTKGSSHTMTPRNKVDVYEFMDEVEDNDAFEFRPTTISERLKGAIKENSLSHSIEPNGEKDEEESGTSVSDGDDFVYMSDDYLCSANETETENSLMSFELGNGSKILTEPRKINSLKRKDSVEKNAVMGKIFKNNAVRNEHRHSSRDSVYESSEKTNLDQLFDSLLEKEPSPSVDVEKVDTSWIDQPHEDPEPTPTMEQYQLSDSETGVARQRARRKCTVGKQNILAETWSSESEQDVNYGRRPNSVESVAPVVRKKKSKKVSSIPSTAGNVRRNRHITFKDQDESRVISPAGDKGGSGRSKRSRSEVAYYCSSAEEEESHALVEQHGWIVGDSHKKLVTMLAHAKGRKRDDKRNLVE